MANFTPTANNLTGPRRICKKHLFAYWGKDKDGNWFKRCVQGNKRNEDCEVLEEVNA